MQMAILVGQRKPKAIHPGSFCFSNQAPINVRLLLLIRQGGDSFAAVFDASVTTGMQF